METWFRFIFLLTTFIVSVSTAYTYLEIFRSFLLLTRVVYFQCWFAHTLRKFSTQDWAIEQKWLSILLPLLLLFNGKHANQ